MELEQHGTTLLSQDMVAGSITAPTPFLRMPTVKLTHPYSLVSTVPAAGTHPLKPHCGRKKPKLFELSYEFGSTCAAQDARKNKQTNKKITKPKKTQQTTSLKIDLEAAGHKFTYIRVCIYTCTHFIFLSNTTLLTDSMKQNTPTKFCVKYISKHFLNLSRSSKTLLWLF